MKKIPMSEFLGCGPTDDASGIHHIGGEMFELRCSSGLVEFEPGRTAQPLPAVLSFLARHGIRRLPLEWDLW